jgi:arabinofuranosyltransferase
VARDDLAIVAGGVAVLLGFGLAEHRIAGVVGLPLDDAWIHLRLATNLATGGGFALNPGEPVAASTAPLWTLLLAAALAAGLPGLGAAKLLGGLGYLAAALAARRLGARLGLAPPLALAAGLATVGFGRLAWGALSGMEVPLAAALVTAAAWAAVAGRHGLAAIGFGLATLARPEAGLLIPLHALGARSVPAGLGRVALGLLVLAPAVAFNWATVGRLVPATAAAKVEGGLLGRLEGTAEPASAAAVRVAGYLGEWAGQLVADHPALPALAVVGALVLRRRGLGALGAVLVLHPVATALLAPYRGPAFQTGRYSSHLLPLLAVLALAGLAPLLGVLAARPAWRRTVLALLALGLVAGLPGAATRYAWGVQNIDAMQVRLGGWVAHTTPPAALIGANDIGALSYFGQRRVLDLMGLATPEILPHRRQGEAGVLRFLETRCPDYLVIFPAWFPALAARADLLQPLVRIRLPHNEVAGADEMVGYETVWNRWRATPVTCPG